MSISKVLSTATTIRQSMVIVLAAALLCLPCLLVGIPESGDAATHTMYQYHFSNQFWSGDLYPRWLAGANKGYGSPIFLVQYPFPYFGTALLRPVTRFLPTATRESHELGVFCFLVLAASGFAARAWFRNQYAPLASTVAAVAYIALPYIVGQTLYDRVSIGELSTFVWMPLILALCDRIHPTRFWVLSAIGVAFALLMLSNILIAVLFAPVMVLYAIVSGKQKEFSLIKRVAPIICSMAIGVGVAATYVFPLLANHRLLDADAVPANHPYAELGRQLLGISLSEVSTYRIAIPGIIIALCVTVFVALHVWRANLALAGRIVLLATLGLGVVMLIPGMGPMLVRLSRLKVSGFDSYNGFCVRMLFISLFTLGLGLLAYCRVSAEGANPRQRLLLAVSCATFVLTLPWSAEIWKAFPEFGSVIQFPWRLCAILSVAASGLFAAAIDDCLRHGIRGEKRPSFVVMILVALVVIGAGNFIWGVQTRFRALSTPGIDMTRGVDPMYPTYVPPLNVTGFAKDLGTSPDTWEVAPSPVVYGVRADLTSGQGNVSVVRTGPRSLLVSAQVHGDGRVRVGQLFWPLWKIVPMPKSARGETLGSSADGLIEVSLGPGQHNFELVFDGGWPERLGDIVTLVSIVVIVAGFAFTALSARKQKSLVSDQEHSFSS